MVRVWNEDPKKSPNPYEEPVIGVLTHIYNILS